MWEKQLVLGSDVSDGIRDSCSSGSVWKWTGCRDKKKTDAALHYGSAVLSGDAWQFPRSKTKYDLDQSYRKKPGRVCNPAWSICRYAAKCGEKSGRQHIYRWKVGETDLVSIKKKRNTCTFHAFSCEWRGKIWIASDDAHLESGKDSGKKAGRDSE